MCLYVKHTAISKSNKNYCIRILLFTFLIFKGSFPVQAQQKYFRFYNTDDGLPSSTIPSGPTIKPVFQDKDGFIWFASFGGISIYDGYHFNNYSTANGGLSDDIVFSFFEKNRDEIWVVETACIDVFVKRKKTRSIPLRAYLFSNFLPTHKGSLLTVSPDAKIYEIRDYKPVVIASLPKEIKVTSTQLDECGDYFLLQDLNADSIYLLDRSFRKIVRQQKGQIFKDNGNRYWYFNSQFYLLDTLALQKAMFKTLPAPYPMNKINLSAKHLVDFLPDRDGYFWIIKEGEKGITRIDNEGYSTHFDIDARNLMEDADRNVWMPEIAGFTKFYNKYNDFYKEADGLPSERVTGIAEDERNGAAWLALDNGISCIYHNKIYNFQYANSVPIHPAFWKFVQVQNDSLWVTTSRLYLYKIFYEPQPHIQLLKSWRPDMNDDKFKTEPIQNFISCFQRHGDGSIFITKENQGLFRATLDGRLQKIHHAGTYSFYIDGNELWTGGGRKDTGIARWKIIYDKDTVRLQLLERFKNLPVIKDERINSIAKDVDGNFWIGTLHTGVLKYEKQKDGSFFMRNYSFKHGLTNQWVTKIFVNPKNEIFVGTMGGGIYQVHQIKDSVYIENLTARYGGVAATRDFVQDTKGNFWLATPVGAVHVRNDIYKKPLAPKVYLTGLLKNNMPDSSIFNISVSKKFSYNQNNLVFEFSAVPFRDEAKVQYSYQLVKGNDSSLWSVPQKIHALSLLSLSPASYIVKIKAVTAENVWSDTPAQYSFIIKPPFWAAWWFRVLIILVVASVLYIFYRYRLNQVKKLLMVRSKISRDLHDDVGSTLSGIGLLSEMAIQQLDNEKIVEVKRSLYKINESSDEMLEKMSDIVWAVNPQNDSFEKIISRLESYAKSIASPLGVQLHIKTDEEAKQVDLDMQERNNIYLICKEAVNNAIKYSGSQQLFFIIEKNNHQLHISVKDDGKGFNADQLFDGNGLKNMKARAKEIKASLNIVSGNGGGTAVELSLNITRL